MSTKPKNCVNRQGLLIPYFSVNGASPTPSMSLVSAIGSDASWGGSSYFSNVQFIDFNSTTTYCGNNQSLINLNTYGADYHP